MKSESFRALKAGFAPSDDSPHIAFMAQTPKRPRDANQLAKFIVDVATGGDEVPSLAGDTDGQRKGGLKGGPARSSAMTLAQRQEIARLAAQARWKKD